MEEFKQYLNSLSIDRQATMLKKLYQEMTAEQKIVILNEIESTLKIDYVIYGVGYEHRLMNDDKIDIIYNEIDLMGNIDLFRILFMFGKGKNYFKCIEDGDEYKEDPNAKKLYQLMVEQLPHISYGIFVEFHWSDNLIVHQFTSAVMECRHCDCLTNYPYEMKYYKINVNGEIKTLLHMKFDTESG